MEADGDAAPDADAPSAVNYADLLSGTTKGGKVKPQEAWALLWSFGFRLPEFAGLGTHWPLNKDEAKELGNATAGLIASLPAKRKAAWEKAIQNTLPGLVFAATLAIVTYPRAQMSLAQIQAKEQEKRRAARERLRPGAAVGAGDQTGDGVAPGAATSEGANPVPHGLAGRPPQEVGGADGWPVDGRAHFETGWPE